MTIRGKVALIVGASGAIGRAVANEFVRRQATVALASRSAPDRALIEGVPVPQNRWIQLDVTDLRSIEKAIERTEACFGPPHVLVNASGAYGPIGPIEANAPTAWAQAVHTNIVGAFNRGC